MNSLVALLYRFGPCLELHYLTLQFFAGIFYISINSVPFSVQFIEKCPRLSVYVISFSAGLDVIITILKTMQCFVSCPPGMQKVAGPREIVSPPSKPCAIPADTAATRTLITQSCSSISGLQSSGHHFFQPGLIRR